jgi:hypothetical protein
MIVEPAPSLMKLCLTRENSTVPNCRQLGPLVTVRNTFNRFPDRLVQICYQVCCFFLLDVYNDTAHPALLLLLRFLARYAASRRHAHDT